MKFNSIRFQATRQRKWNVNWPTKTPSTWSSLRLLELSYGNIGQS